MTRLDGGARVFGLHRLRGKPLAQLSEEAFLALEEAREAGLVQWRVDLRDGVAALRTQLEQLTVLPAGSAGEAAASPYRAFQLRAVQECCEQLERQARGWVLQVPAGRAFHRVDAPGKRGDRGGAARGRSAGAARLSARTRHARGRDGSPRLCAGQDGDGGGGGVRRIAGIELGGGGAERKRRGGRSRGRRRGRVCPAGAAEGDGGGGGEAGGAKRRRLRRAQHRARRPNRGDPARPRRAAAPRGTRGDSL